MYISHDTARSQALSLTWFIFLQSTVLKASLPVCHPKLSLNTSKTLCFTSSKYSPLSSCTSHTLRCKTLTLGGTSLPWGYSHRRRCPTRRTPHSILWWEPHVTSQSRRTRNTGRLLRIPRTSMIWSDLYSLCVIYISKTRYFWPITWWCFFHLKSLSTT